MLHVPPVFDVRLLARRSISYRNNSGYDLTIDHLPANRRYSVERCRISAANDFTSVGTTIYANAPIRLQNELPPPGIELVTLRAVDEHCRGCCDAASGRHGHLRNSSTNGPKCRSLQCSQSPTAFVK